MTRKAAALLVTLALTLSGALARADASTPMPARPGTPAPPRTIHDPPRHAELATLQRTACFGTCPIYKVTLYADGWVEYDGEAFVKEKGRRSGRASAADLAALRQAIADAHYAKLADHYDCYDVTDNPSANSSFTLDDGRRKSVTHYYGCSSAPKMLFTVEAAIDKAAHIEKWVGTEKEREALRRSGKLR